MVEKTLSIVNPNVLKILRGPLKEFYKKIGFQKVGNVYIEMEL